MTHKSAVSIQNNEDGVRVAACGSLDLAIAGQFKDVLYSAVDSGSEVEVDLRDAVYVDSAGLQRLVRAGRRMMDQERRLRVRIVQGSYPHRVLEITGLQAILDIVAEPAEPR